MAAVALAAALVVAVSTCIATVRDSISQRLVAVLGAADARIIHLFQGRFDADLLEEVASWTEVDLAVGRYSGSLTLVRADHRADPETGLPERVTPLAHGVEFGVEWRMRPIDLADGVFPADEGEILIDSIIASTLKVEVGNEVEVQRFGEPLRFRVAGIYDRPVLGVLQRPQVQVSRAALERATERHGFLTDVAIVLHEGVDIEEFCARYVDRLPDELSLEPAEMSRTGFDRRMNAANIAAILISIFTFLSCSYLIVIGMTTGVNERQRELAIVRSVGGARSQVFLAQIWVGLIVGMLGIIIGVPLGVGLAAFLAWYFYDLLQAALSIGWNGVALASAGALGAGLLGAVFPAVQAARVTPLRAAASRAAPPRRRHVIIFIVLAVIGIGIHLLLLLPASEQVRFWLYVTTGLPLMQTSYFLLAIPVFMLVVVVIGRPLGRLLALRSNLLSQSAMTVPYRLGLTAGALMIGIALLVGTWTSTASLLTDWLGQMRFADGFAYSRNGINQRMRDRIAELPFVRDICPIAYLPLRVQNRHIFGVEGLAPPNVICIGFEPELFFRVNEVEWVVGSQEEAVPRLISGEGILVAEEFLTARGISVGDRLELGAGRVSHEFEIVGVVSAAGLDVATQMFGIRDAYHEHALSCVFADFRTIATVFDNPDVYIVQINLSEDISDDEAREQLARAAPGTLFVSGRSIKQALDDIGRAMLTVNSTIAFAALLLSSIAVGNVLVANVASRQFEYAVLRAVGASRSHLVRLVYGEALLIGIAAIIVGTVFGMHGALMDMAFQRDLLGLNPALHIPWMAIVIGWAVVLLMTAAAAAPAAIRLVRKSPRELLAPGRGGA